MKAQMEEAAWPHLAPLIWLLDCDATVTDAQLDDFATYGQGIGPDKVSTGHLAPLVAQDSTGTA